MRPHAWRFSAAGLPGAAALLGLAGLLCWLNVTPVSAHELWLEPVDGGLALYSGHKHSSHEGDDFVPYDVDFVKDVACFGDQGRPQSGEIARGYPLQVKGLPAVVCITASSGYWSKTPYGTRNVPKNQASQVIQSWLSLETVKFISVWTPALARPLTAGLELVPLEDPFAVGEGDKLRLLVTLAGRPASGAIVTYDGKPRGQTGDDGKINIRLRHAAFQSIAASLTLPFDGPEADQVVHTAHLNFQTGNE